MNYVINTILQKAENTHRLELEEIIQLLDLEENTEEQKAFFSAADRVREKYVGNYIHLRGLIEFSNYCKRNCNYCGIRAKNTRVHRYRISEEEIFEIANKAAKLGYRTLVLQSGEDPYFTVKKLKNIVKTIKEKNNVAITLCVGELSHSDYDELIQAGIDRYLLRIETTNAELFKQLHPDDDFYTRMELLRYLKKKNVQVGTGIMIGLPGQTTEMLAQDILFYQELDVDMVGQGPFIASPDTPMAEEKNGDVFTTLKVIAATRLLCPDIHIPATTALATLSITDARQRAFRCGANVVMPNVTPQKYRAFYELYPDKACIGEDSDECRACIGGIIASCGLEVGRDFGHRIKKTPA